MSKLTLEDIADLAGVSRSTVSRVINNHRSVSFPVRQRVLEIIESTGFQPNPAARSLASQRTSILGLVIPRSAHTFFTDPFFPRLTQGIAEACNAHNYTLSLFLFHTEEDERKLLPRISRRGMLDGVIIQSTHATDDLFVQLVQSDIPYVVAGRPMHASAQDSYVDVDNVAGAHLAVRHLIQLGRRRIGTVAGPLITAAGLDRLEGYKQALEESGLAFDERLCAESDFTESGGYFNTKRLLAQRPDALFIASDIMAIGAMRAIREAGLSIPEDVAIVSFDDLPPAGQANPPLTTVRQPILQLGKQLVETLLSILENGVHPPHRVIFGTELVIRESCGANRRKPRKVDE